ncbi:MAG: glutamine synthetase beta-grasp domain-containing protein, partial [bacterium]
MAEQFTLVNPLVRFLKKPRAEFTRADFLRLIAERQIERIAFHYTGLDGRLKELRLPVANRHEVERVLAEGERVDGSSLFKGLVDTAMSDLYVVPVYRTAFLNPFHKGSLDFICRYLTPAGDLAPFTLDNILHKAHSLFQKRTGLELHAMGELEFFLLSDPQVRIYPMRKQGGYHASSPFLKNSEMLDEMVRHLSQITSAVKFAHRRYYQKLWIGEIRKAAYPW